MCSERDRESRASKTTTAFRLRKKEAGVMIMEEAKVLDHGFVRYIEHWGSDERIIEAARMSTGKGFQGWNRVIKCVSCGHTWECATSSAACNFGECQLKNSPTKEVH